MGDSFPEANNSERQPEVGWRSAIQLRVQRPKAGLPNGAIHNEVLPASARTSGIYNMQAFWNQGCL